MDANEWDARYATSELIWSEDANRFVVAELSDVPPGRAYDIATGEGRNAIWLARRGWDVTAADFSAVGLNKARQLAEAAPSGSVRPIHWVLADVTEQGPEPGSYDLVLAAYLQLAPAERRLAMRSAARALRAGGTLLVIAHDSSNLAEGFGGPQDPAVLYTAADVLSDVAEVPDLVVEHATRVPRVVSVEGTERTAWDALARLRKS